VNFAEKRLGQSIDRQPVAALKRFLARAGHRGGLIFLIRSRRILCSVVADVNFQGFPEVLMLTVKNSVHLLVAGTLAAAMFVVTGSEALARPKYLNVANATYPDLVKKHGTDGKLTCALCHPEKDKKIRNNYAAAVGGKLEKKNETDEAKIKEALTKAEGEKSATEGKTFGDLITAGELPGTNEAAK